MTGTGPLGRKPAGTFNFAPPSPGRALYLEPSPKRIRIEVGSEIVADSRRAMLLHESGQQPIYYFPPDDVRSELLEPSDTVTGCPYKGSAGYHSVKLSDGETAKDLIWTYDDPLPEAGRIAGLLCFFNEKVDIELDGELQRRPASPWSHGVKSDAQNAVPAQTRG